LLTFDRLQSFLPNLNRGRIRHDAKLRKALLAAAEIVNSSDSQDTRAMFDALVNPELILRTTVEDNLIETTLRPEWRATKVTASTVYH